MPYSSRPPTPGPVDRPQYRLKAPNAIMFSKKNDTNPMEDETSAEFLMAKNDCALVAFGSHNKKRPDNLVLVSADTRRMPQVTMSSSATRGVSPTNKEATVPTVP